MDGFRQGVLKVHTPLDAPYPAVVNAEVFRDVGIVGWGEMLTPLPDKQANWADNEDELSAIVAQVFQAPAESAVIEHLIARVLEQRKAKQSAP